MNQDYDKDIDDAVKREKDAYDHYCKMIKHADNPNLETFFRKIAVEELKHEHLLEEFKKTKDFLEAKQNMENQYYNTNFSIVDDLNAAMDIKSLDQAFLQALKFEHEAMMTYQAKMTRATNDQLKDLFYFLTKEEENHERLLRKEYAKYQQLSH